MKFSILMFCPQFRPLIGGTERQAEKLAIALAVAGCRIRVLTPRIDPKSPETEIIDGVEIRRFAFTDLARRFPIRGIAVLNIPYVIWQIAVEVRRNLRGVDLLHCHNGSLQTLGAIVAGRLVGVPVLCKAAVADRRSDLGEIEKTGYSGVLVAWMVRAFNQTWVATTAAVERALINAGVDPYRIVRIPNGVVVSSTANTMGGVNGARRFLYLGRLQKNTSRDVATLIEAFGHLAKTLPDLELAIIGGGDLFSETAQLVEASAARDRIRLPGFDDPGRWFAWADCFVLPSRREGLSNALLEAMASGLPCIANDIAPNHEVLAGGDAGILVAVGDVVALEDAMRRVVESPEVAMHFGEMARLRVVQHYSINVVGDAYLALYEKLLIRRKVA